MQVYCTVHSTRKDRNTVPLLVVSRIMNTEPIKSFVGILSLTVIGIDVNLERSK